MIVGGLDEVGWGAIAGPIISTIAVFRDIDLAMLPAGVTDSKKLSEAKREALYLPLCAAAFDVGIGHAWPWEVDHLSPYLALQLSYQRAIEDLTQTTPELLIVDGSNRVSAWKGTQRVEAKADLNHPQVSAASIIAKVFRDRIMVQLSKRYPHYDWENNKGYESARHAEAIRRFGLITKDGVRDEYIHRRRYCAKFM